MRKLLLLLVALAWFGTADADEGPAVKEAAPVSAESAHAYVRRLAKAARAKKEGLGPEPSDWGVRPSALSRWVFGTDYDNLSATQKRPVDTYSWLVTLGMLRTMYKGRLAPLDLSSEVIDDGLRLVFVPGGRWTLEVVLAHSEVDGQLDIVDIGVAGTRLGNRLKGAWSGIAARSDAKVDRSALLLDLVATLTKKTHEAARKAKSKDNIRSLVVLMLVRVTEKGWKYYPYGGKCFVLGAVASGDLDRSNANNLAILFSPNVAKSERAPVEAYKDVTRDALKAGHDCSKLTSYAGRRNNERAHIVSAREESQGTILIADLSFKDVVIAGFSNGRVAELTRDQLGLGPDDPITVGDESKSPMLKKLSLK